MLGLTEVARFAQSKSGMFTNWFNKVVCIALAVLMVANCGVSTLRHSHAGEDHSADHTSSGMKSETIGEHCHGHSHHDHGDHKHCTHPCDAADLSPDGRHVHLSCFGYCFTFPSPVDSDTNNEVPVAVDLTVGGKSVASTMSAQPLLVTWLDLGSQLPQGLREVLPAGALTCFSSTPTPMAPLCDVARHERSGAQLI